MNKKYYYKIRSYTAGEKTLYGAYSEKVTIKTKIVDKPKVYVSAWLYYGYDGVVTTDIFKIGIANAGKYNIKVLTKGKMSDVVRTNYNRNLKLIEKIKGKYYYVEPFIIEPTYVAKEVIYIVEGSPTYYNRDYASIIIYYEYQGKTFKKAANSYDNDKYYEYVY